MSLDQSLKTGGALSKHNNVLKRTVRIAKMQDEGRWNEETSPFGLPKLAHRKSKIGGKTKKKTEDAAETKEGAAAK